jgi:hypothetical protein
MPAILPCHTPAIRGARSAIRQAGGADVDRGLAAARLTHPRELDRVALHDRLERDRARALALQTIFREVEADWRFQQGFV